MRAEVADEAVDEVDVEGLMIAVDSEVVKVDLVDLLEVDMVLLLAMVDIKVAVVAADITNS